MVKPLREVVAKNVRQLRVLRGLTQGELARKAGLTNVYVSRMEKTYGNLTLDSLEALAKALDTSVTKLIEGSGGYSVKKVNKKFFAESMRQAALALEAFADELETEE